MNKLRADGFYLMAISIVMALNTAFRWKDFIAPIIIFAISLLFLSITERDNQTPARRSCLMYGILLIAITIILAAAAGIIIWLGQKFGIPVDMLIYLISGTVCLVGFGMVIWSFLRPSKQSSGL